MSKTNHPIEYTYLCRINKEDRTVTYVRFTFDKHYGLFRMREHCFWRGEWRQIQCSKRSSEAECRALLAEKIAVLKHLGYIEIDRKDAPKGKQK